MSDRPALPFGPPYASSDRNWPQPLPPIVGPADRSRLRTHPFSRQPSTRLHPRSPPRPRCSARESWPIGHVPRTVPPAFPLGFAPTIMARYARRPSGTRRPRGPWKHGPLPVLGLVGGMGAGKSAVAAELSELGAQVLDADAIGHALLTQRPAFEAVVDRFGPEVVGPDGVIDRRRLGAIVFEHPPARRDLEEILHPRMRKTFERAILRAARKAEVRAIVLDAAILYEAGWDDLCDRVVFVDAPAESRLARLASQRGWDAATLEARERAQLSEAIKRQRAGLVVRNDSDLEALRTEVAGFWDKVVGPPPRSPSPTPRRPPVHPLRDGPTPPTPPSATPTPTPQPTARSLPGRRLDEET